MRSGHTLITVDPEDALGTPLGVKIPVEIDYIREDDYSYGADAYGNRGTLVSTIDILDCYINPACLRILNSDQVESALTLAKNQLCRMFDRGEID